MAEESMENEEFNGTTIELEEDNQESSDEYPLKKTAKVQNILEQHNCQRRQVLNSFSSSGLSGLHKGLERSV